MKKLILSLLAAHLFALIAPLHAADEKKVEKPAAAESEPAKPAGNVTDEGKYAIMKRDQIDTSDVFAIQLDDSEVEDEEEINRLEGKDVFNLPKAK